MWDKPHLLRQISGALFGFSFALLMYGVLYFVLHLPVFPLRVLQLQFGGHPGTALSSATADNWEQLATRTEKVAADPDYQALIARSSQLSGFPFSDAAEVRIIEDITAEVGGTRAPMETAQVIEVISMRVLPGKRAKLIDLIRQIREARAGAGLPQSNVLQTVVGAANLLSVARPYANLQAWAKDRSTPVPKAVTDIQQRVLADPQGPYSEAIATRVYSDITNQL